MSTLLVDSITLKESIKCVHQYYQLDEWVLYSDLIDTKDNLENISFYDWNIINNDYRYKYIKELLNDFKNNYDEILKITEEIILDKTNEHEGFCVINKKITIEDWVLDGLMKCNICGNIWDGYAQCLCGNY